MAKDAAKYTRHEQGVLLRMREDSRFVSIGLIVMFCFLCDDVRCAMYDVAMSNKCASNAMRNG